MWPPREIELAIRSAEKPRGRSTVRGHEERVGRARDGIDWHSVCSCVLHPLTASSLQALSLFGSTATRRSPSACPQDVTAPAGGRNTANATDGSGPGKPRAAGMRLLTSDDQWAAGRKRSTEGTTAPVLPPHEPRRGRGRNLTVDCRGPAVACTVARPCRIV